MQRYSVDSGAYIRQHFFGRDPRLLKMVRAPERRPAAAGCAAAATTTASSTRPTPRPSRTAGATVILAKTIKAGRSAPAPRRAT